MTGTLLELLHATDHGALIEEDRRTPWSAVLARAWQGAHFLREYGVRPGDRVAILLPPSLEAIVFALASLAAGAVYVPLDSASPSRRSALVVANAAPKILITKHARQAEALLSELAVEQRPPLVVIVDEGPEVLDVAVRRWSALDAFPTTRPTLELEPEALAYILFTSGSTGHPKGVAISHRAARSFVDWSLEVSALAPGDVVGAFTPLHFDLSVFDLYASIAAGAELVIVPRRLVSFAGELVEFLATHKISVVYTVPTVLVQMVLRGGLEQRPLPQLRLVMFAGEVFPLKHLRALMLALPGRRYLNLYGPTETNVCCYHELDEPPSETGPSTPIGRACAGAIVFALDESGKPVAPGEVGELHVAGPVLMHGYWGQAAHAGLIPDPRAATPELAELVYRTGDLVSVDAAGIHTWVGRCCQTIKSAGYRIEPGEVEHCLLEHPDVTEAYVLARPHETLGAELEAVVVGVADSRLEASVLLAHCARALPRWMIPARVHIRTSVPRTSTGKVDRGRLLEEAQDP